MLHLLVIYFISSLTDVALLLSQDRRDIYDQVDFGKAAGGPFITTWALKQ